MMTSTNVPARALLARDEAESMIRAGALVLEDRRRRPKYFDGRFLAARDLTRDQNYFLSRQADLGRAVGSGVVEGLTVEPSSGAASRLTLTPGHGITLGGEHVVLSRSLEIDLANVPEMQRLDAAFGLQRLPREPARSRTGLYVLALRPVEFTANPITSYPTSIAGQRSIEDGDIIEAVAVTLTPFPDDGGNLDFDRRRARAARAIFLLGREEGLSTGSLPLAMVAIQSNSVRWVDPFLVRREAGAGHRDILGLGFAPRILRESHVLQYEEHLGDVMEQLRGQPFPASSRFEALPPAGRLPVSTINPADFTQTYFPPEIAVDLSIIPDDELPALIEEGLLLPPIDLTLPGEALESTSVLVLVPVPRARFANLRLQLVSLGAGSVSAAPNLLAARKPLEMLRSLTFRRLAPPILATKPLDVATWQSVLQQAPGDGLLWYVRRRNLAYTAAVTGRAGRARGDETQAEDDLADVLEEEKLQAIFTRIKKRATARAVASIVRSLSSSEILDTPLFLHSALDVLAARVAALAGEAKLTSTAALVDLEPFNDVQLGEGWRLLTQANASLEDAVAVKALVSARVAVELDRLGRSLRADQIKPFADELRKAIRDGANDSARAEAARALTLAKLEEIRDEG